MPSAMRPKNGGFGMGSGIEEAEVEMEREERGDVRRGESIEVLGLVVRVDEFERVRWGRAIGWGCVECCLEDCILGDCAGLSDFGDWVGVAGREVLWPRRPKMPGSRCPKGRIALNMCVTIVEPACRACWACSNVASEWPVE